MKLTGFVRIFAALLMCFVFSEMKTQTDSIPYPGNIKKGGMLVMKDSVSAQKKEAVMKSDTTRIKKPKVHSPKKAALYSALLPGLGQAYNRKYWKIPIIAAGTGALFYSYNFNQSRFSRFKGELIKRQQNLGNLDPDLDRYSDANLNEFQDFYRRNRDLTIVGFALLYALNIIDATVDAHLFDFSVNDDLSLHLRPASIPMTAFGGLSIQLHF
jgi:hypothetical protein